MSIGEQRVVLRATGDLHSLDDATARSITDRSNAQDSVVRSTTALIIEQVRNDGDAALRELARTLDRVTLKDIEVPRALWEAALASLSPTLVQAMHRAARNIASVHTAFMPSTVQVSPEPGITITRRPDPLHRVGVYAPGGRAAYPSSLLMGAIPARVAGVGEVIVCSPPGANGLPSAVVLAAAAIAKVDRVFAVGGAGAIAAMAFGTATIPAVDRIVGPGNAYVAEAKIQLSTRVTIDAPAGPSELLVLADETAQPNDIAREMVAQAEHDPDAAVIAVLCGAHAELLSTQLQDALQQLVATTPREQIVRESFAARGAIVTTSHLTDGIAFANTWAAEHLALIVRDSVLDSTVSALKNTGTIFIGASSSVAFGDYMTGANHVLPTAGAARNYSGLSTLDFVRWTTTQQISPAAASALADDVGTFADAEQLPAHAAAARAWQSRGPVEGTTAGSTQGTTPVATP